MVIRSICAFIALSLLPACFLKHASVDYLTAPVTLSGQPSVYVALPEDGQFVKYIHKGTGKLVQNEIVAGLGSYTRLVVAGMSVESSDKQIKGSAEAAACTYTIVPKILHWKDERTEWTAKPDVIKIRVDLIRTSDFSVMQSAMINGSSTWWTLGGDHPEHLLNEPISVLIDNLMGGK